MQETELSETLAEKESDDMPTGEPILEKKDNVLSEDGNESEEQIEDGNESEEQIEDGSESEIKDGEIQNAGADENPIITPEDTEDSADDSEEDGIENNNTRIDKIEKQVENLVNVLNQLKIQISDIEKKHSEDKDDTIKLLESTFSDKDRHNINYTDLFSRGKIKQTAKEKEENRARVFNAIGHKPLSKEKQNDADRTRRQAMMSRRGLRSTSFGFGGQQGKKLYLKKTKKAKKAKNLKPSKKSDTPENVEVDTPENIEVDTPENVEVHKNVAVQTPKNFIKI